MANNNTRALVPETTKAIVEYGDWTPEQMADETQELGSDGAFWKPPEGMSTVRFLPPKVGWKSPFLIQHQHYFKVPGFEHDISFCCPRLHAGQPCRVCERAERMIASGSRRDARAAEDLRPQKRVLANVVVGPKDPKAKVQVWGFGKTVFNSLKSIRENEEGGGNFLHPKTGFNLTIKREGTSKSTTRYTVIPARSASTLANMEWINQQVDLRTKMRIPTLDQQERLLEGEDPKDVWGSDDGTGPDGDERRRSARGRTDDGGVIDVDATERPTAEDDAFGDEVDVD